MPGFDDPRYLQQVITDLQQRIKKLEGASLPFLANQRGALPGTMRGVQIGDPGLKSAMWLNLIGQLAGQAPYQAVTDAAGVVRAEIGNLAARGISPAQYGFRANDSGGNPIFDSLGVIGAATLLGSEDLGHVTQGGSGTGFGTIQSMTGTGVNFTLSRQGNLLLLSRVSVLMTGGVQNYCALYHAIWTQGGALVSRQQVGTVEPAQGVNHFVTLLSVFSGVSAGSLQFREEFALDAGTTTVEFGGGATGISPHGYVIQLGG